MRGDEGGWSGVGVFSLSRVGDGATVASVFSVISPLTRPVGLRLGRRCGRLGYDRPGGAAAARRAWRRGPAGGQGANHHFKNSLMTPAARPPSFQFCFPASASLRLSLSHPLHAPHPEDPPLPGTGAARCCAPSPSTCPRCPPAHRRGSSSQDRGENRDSRVGERRRQTRGGRGRGRLRAGRRGAGYRGWAAWRRPGSGLAPRRLACDPG